MSVVFYEPVLARVLTSPLGMVGRDLARRAAQVEAKAKVNASGAVIGIRNSYLTKRGYDHGALESGIYVSIEEGPFGLVASVGTPAEHNEFSYPAYWDQNGRPWLTDALQEAIL